MATATALGEKAEMQFLNNKLAEYMNRVKPYTNISFRCMYIIIYNHVYNLHGCSITTGGVMDGPMCFPLT